MEDVKTLLGKVNLSLKKNLGKTIIALLLVFLISACLAPVAMILVASGGAMVSLSAIVMPLFAMILFMLQISFAQMCAKMYREEPCVLGNILDCFRDWRRCGGLGLIYGLASVIICFVVVLSGMGVLLILSGGDPNYFQSENTLATLLSVFPVMIMICMVAFFLLVLLPTSFTHLVLMDNKELPLITAIRENFRLLKGKKIQLMSFLLRAGGFWLLGAVVFMVAGFVIVSVMYQQLETATGLLTALRLVSQICDMLYFICVYTTLIRLVTAVAVFYQAILDEEAGIEAPLQINHKIPLEENSSSTEDV